MGNNIYMEEIYYTIEEENEVIKELRLGLLMGEIGTTIERKKLKNWFATIQIKKLNWCENITTPDLVGITQECGIKVV